MCLRIHPPLFPLLYSCTLEYLVNFILYEGVGVMKYLLNAIVLMLSECFSV